MDFCNSKKVADKIEGFKMKTDEEKILKTATSGEYNYTI
jgi:hypothetical protein